MIGQWATVDRWIWSSTVWPPVPGYWTIENRTLISRASFRVTHTECFVCGRLLYEWLGPSAVVSRVHGVRNVTAQTADVFITTTPETHRVLKCTKLYDGCGQTMTEPRA